MLTSDLPVLSEGIGSGGAAGGEEARGEGRLHDKRHSGGECSCIRG